jgi:hypothetical protein
VFLELRGSRDIFLGFLFWALVWRWVLLCFYSGLEMFDSVGRGLWSWMVQGREVLRMDGETCLTSA